MERREKVSHSNPFIDFYLRSMDVYSQAFRTTTSLMREPYRNRLQENRYEPVDAGAGDFGVILSHGLGRDSEDMEPYRQKFLESGFNPAEVQAITYSDFITPLRRGAIQQEEYLREWSRDTGIEKFSGVGHSMGALVLRYLDSELERDYFDTIVAISGPNSGSGWNEMLRSSGMPSMDDISLGSAADGILGELDGDADYLTITGTHDGGYFLRKDSPMIEDAVNVVMRGGHDVKDAQDAIEAAALAVESDSIEDCIDEIEALDRVETVL